MKDSSFRIRDSIGRTHDVCYNLGDENIVYEDLKRMGFNDRTIRAVLPGDHPPTRMSRCRANARYWLYRLALTKEGLW